jgi:4-amino-4-deoxy-L-arabinose transferase-like glycosyltransferase
MSEPPAGISNIETTSSPSVRMSIAAIATVTIVTAVLMVHRLGAADVCSGNEAVEGVFVQQMVEHGKMLFPLENGRIPMYKPPLFHWTAATIDRVAGITKVTAANLRYPSALYATAGALLTMIFAYGILGLDGAILAGLALAGSYQYVSQGRFGRVDMTLTFCETLALMSFMWWLPRTIDPARGGTTSLREQWSLYVVALAMGLAVLAKGPVGTIIPGLAIVIFMAVEKRAAQILAMLQPGPVILGAAVASSWYLACYFGGRYGFLDRQLGAENLGRFIGTLGAMAPWYYAKPLFLNSAPLSILVPIAVVTAIASKRDRSSESDAGNNSRLESERARLSVRLFAIFWLVTVAFFTVAAYKRRAYLLPIWPASAVMLAWWIKSFGSSRLFAARRWARLAKWGFAAMCYALIVFNFIYLPHKEVKECAGDSFRPAAEEIERVVSAGEPLYVFGFNEELAPLLFYLDRDAPVLEGRLGDAPPGYVIVPAAVWKAHQGEALDLEPVLTSEHGRRSLVLLKRGKSYASARQLH